MPKAIIIEDEPHAASLLEAMLAELDPEMRVLEKCGDLPCGVRSIRRHSPDIVFLDIQLPLYSGIQLLDFFNPEELNFQLIFTTASNEYAVQAFEMSAIDYLMKPIQEEKLKAALKKAGQERKTAEKERLPILKQHLLHENVRKIVVPVTNGFEILNVRDICYLKAEGSYTRIFFSSQENILVSKNLKHFEFIMAGIPSFLRIHRSYIANMDFARKILRTNGGALLLEGNTELAISEDRMEGVLGFFKAI